MQLTFFPEQLCILSPAQAKNLYMTLQVPTYAVYKGSTWQSPWGKAGLPTPDLVHNPCVPISKGSYSRGLSPQQPAFQNHVLPVLQVPLLRPP